MSVQVDQYEYTNLLLFPPFPTHFSNSRSKRLPSAQEIRLARSASYSPPAWNTSPVTSTQYEVRRPLRTSSSISSMTSASSSSSTFSRHDSVFSTASSRSSSFSGVAEPKSRAYFKTGFKPLGSAASTPSTSPVKISPTKSTETSTPRRTTTPVKTCTPTCQNVSRRSAVRLLPPEVFGCIIQHLETLYSRECDNSALFTRDLYNLSLANRAWNHASRKFLYAKLWIKAEDLQPQFSKLLSKPNLRLKALRRTLRLRHELAQSVREIRVLDYSHDQEALGNVPEDILTTLATLVASCPNLESVSGLYTTYTHEYRRLTQALSTRTRLKEHVWIIGPNGGTWNGEKLLKDSRYSHPLLNGDQLRGFIHVHECWQGLKTLILCSDHDGTLDHARLFSDTFKALPALENLMISGFVAHEFDDSHLSSLPRNLRSLRLEDLPGVTEQGLMGHFASTLTPDDRSNLHNLSFTDMTIHSLANTALLFTLLPHLRRFTLVTTALRLPPCTTIADFAAPALSNHSLEYLHWEVHPSPTTPSPDYAHTLLATSIRAAGFPALRRLRIPSDPRGILQAVCRPLPLPASRSIDKTYFASRGKCYACAQGASCDKARSLSHVQARAIGRAMRSLGSWHGGGGGGGGSCSTTTTTSSSVTSRTSNGRERTHFEVPRATSSSSASSTVSRSVPPSPGLVSMTTGQRYAPSNSSDAGEGAAPCARVVVFSPEGRVVEDVECALFLGTLGPEVPEYWLESDVEGSEEAVMSVVHLLGEARGWGAPRLERFF